MKSNSKSDMIRRKISKLPRLGYVEYVEYVMKILGMHVRWCHCGDGGDFTMCEYVTARLKMVDGPIKQG